MEYDTVTQGYEVARAQRVRWGAVFSGLAIAFGVIAVCLGLSWAIGLSTFQPTAPKATGLALGLLIWSPVALCIGLFCGGWVAATTAHATERRDGLLHGLVVWGAVTALLGLVFLGVFLQVVNSLLQLTGANNVAARAGVVEEPSLGFGVQLVVAKMARDAGVVLWIYWAGIAGSMLASAVGGWLGARVEQKEPVPHAGFTPVPGPTPPAPVTPAPPATPTVPQPV